MLPDKARFDHLSVRAYQTAGVYQEYTQEERVLALRRAGDTFGMSRVESLSEERCRYFLKNQLLSLLWLKRLDGQKLTSHVS